MSGRFRPTAGDLLLPAGIFLLAAVELAVLHPARWGVGLAAELVACALLVGRRRFPLLLGTGAVLAVLVTPWLGPQLDEAAVPILVVAAGMYALARWLSDLRGLVGVAVVAVAFLVDYLVVDGRRHDVSDVFFISALVLPPYVLGRLARRLADQKALLEERQELVRREAVRAERDRIAREMHDVIAHSVSAMVVQTAAAQDLVRADPAGAERLLGTVADTGRRALAETGRLLHVLRDEAGELGLAPAPGLAELPSLLEQFRDSGLRLELDLPGPLPALPAGVEVSAYRIVQEALTNALRHGADRTARLHLAATPTALVIRSTNRCGPGTGKAGGLGLVGMAERVSLVGGTLSSGVGRDGTFELAVTLPVAPA